MKFFPVSIALLIVAISAAPSPQGGAACASDICLPPEIVCPDGGAPTGNPGCLTCCRLGRPPICNGPCLIEKPECSVNTVASGHEGCWGCCIPV